MSEYVEYITRQGDRADLIAFYFYGSFYRYPQILLDNPILLQKPVKPLLPSGIVLRIAVEDPAPQLVDPAMLPPWKR